MTGQLAYIME